MASAAFHGSATPSPLPSVPYWSQVEGMNCIQPIAPAELGPMFRPKFDSILLIAASTFHGMAYEWPAFCQRPSSWSYDSWTGWTGRCVHPDASDTLLPLGTVALGSAGVPVTTEKVE